MRIIWYRNSFLASVVSIFGTILLAVGIVSVFSGGPGILIGLLCGAAGFGLMWLGSYISRKKEERKYTRR